MNQHLILWWSTTRRIRLLTTYSLIKPQEKQEGHLLEIISVGLETTLFMCKASRIELNRRILAYLPSSMTALELKQSGSSCMHVNLLASLKLAGRRQKSTNQKWISLEITCKWASCTKLSFSTSCLRSQDYLTKLIEWTTFTTRKSSSSQVLNSISGRRRPRRSKRAKSMKTNLRVLL